MFQVKIEIGYGRHLAITTKDKKTARGIMRQVADAIEYRHTLDLKTTNGEWLIPYHDLGPSSLTEVNDDQV